MIKRVVLFIKNLKKYLENENGLCQFDFERWGRKVRGEASMIVKKKGKITWK